MEDNNSKPGDRTMNAAQIMAIGLPMVKQAKDWQGGNNARTYITLVGGGYNARKDAIKAWVNPATGELTTRSGRGLTPQEESSLDELIAVWPSVLDGTYQAPAAKPVAAKAAPVARKMQAANWDALINEGGEGYNPYRNY